MKITIITLIILILSAVLATPVVSALKSEDKIKYRQSAYTFMRWNVGIIKKLVVKEPEKYNKQTVVNAANVIAAIANSGLGRLFTPDTKSGEGWKKTRVKPEFFSQPEEVKKLALAFKAEADDLATVAQTGNVAEIKDQFERLFKACKACHKKYREKE